MNIEAIIVIGGITALLGAILFLPLVFWKKWKSEKSFPSSGIMSLRVTQNGIRFYGVMIAFLFVGYSQEYIASGSYFGKFIGMWSGKLTYSLGLIVIFAIVAEVFSMFGIKFIETEDKNV